MTRRDDPDALLHAHLRAQRQATSALPPPSIIPAPVFPAGRQFRGTVRFPCPIGCGWFHDEHPGSETPGPLLLPVGFTSEDIEDALTARAAAEGETRRRRIEGAITAHYRSAHPSH
ncbi:hypothetical protein [Nonomuraea recticatena]|uniref:Uncharacterized protein n=1 Tax=Nonomuraea recticatena TaxID=46178 RepID=A0ABP6FV31_9ACTN